jgi:hypothetical protein
MQPLSSNEESALECSFVLVHCVKRLDSWFGVRVEGEEEGGGFSVSGVDFFLLALRAVAAFRAILRRVCVGKVKSWQVEMQNEKICDACAHGPWRRRETRAKEKRKEKRAKENFKGPGYSLPVLTVGVMFSQKANRKQID